MQGGQLYEQRWGSLQPTYDLCPYFGHVLSSMSRDHKPDKFAVGEQNIAIRYSFCIWLCNMNVIMEKICRPEGLPVV